jgi:hypothetical protein
MKETQEQIVQKLCDSHAYVVPKGWIRAVLVALDAAGYIVIADPDNNPAPTPRRPNCF